MPKLGNYSIFEGLSKKWNVNLFFGSNYNVAERIYNASKRFEPDIIVRVLLRRFYVDMDLINSLILNKTNENVDKKEILIRFNKLVESKSGGYSGIDNLQPYVLLELYTLLNEKVYLEIAYNRINNF